jgi:gas vesicle protein
MAADLSFLTIPAIILSTGLTAMGISKVIWGGKVKPECKRERDAIKKRQKEIESDSSKQWKEIREMASTMVALKQLMEGTDRNIQANFNDFKQNLKEILSNNKELFNVKINVITSDIDEIKKDIIKIRNGTK